MFGVPFHRRYTVRQCWSSPLSSFTTPSEAETREAETEQGRGGGFRNRYRGEQLHIVSAFALISRAVEVYAADEITTGRLNAQKIAVDALMAADLIFNIQVSCQFG